MSVSADVERFIVDELALGGPITTLERHDNLLTSGMIDSHGVIELLGFLEESYGIAIADADVDPENFESLARIEAFVTRKRTELA